MSWSEFSFILKPSPIGGIGVFATHDIAKGTPIFQRELEFEIRIMKIEEVPAAFLPYCIYINDTECFCPKRFDHMQIGWYINHSATPNIAKTPSDPTLSPIENIKNRKVFAIKDIKEGDEILIDYNCLDEPEKLKENFYKAT